MGPLPLPALEVDGALAPFATIAVAMVVVTVVVLGLVRPGDGRPPLVTQLLLALAVICGGSVLLLALVFVFLDTNGTTAWTWVLTAFNFMMVAPVGLWFIGQIVFEDRRTRAGNWIWPIALGLAVTGSEVLMGLLFVIGGVAGAIGAGAAVADGLSSVWFFWSMAGIMAPLVRWAPLSRVGRVGGGALVIAAAVGPWVRSFPLYGGVAMAVVMTGALVAILQPLLHERVASEDGGLLLALAGAFVAMTVTGLAVAASGAAEPAVIAFGTTMAVVMVGEVGYLLRRTYQPVAEPAPSLEASAPRAAVDVGGGAHPGPLAGP